MDVTKRFYDVHKRGLSPVTQVPATQQDTVNPDRVREIFKQLSDKLETDNVPRFSLYKQFDLDHDGNHLLRICKYGGFQRNIKKHENPCHRSRVQQT